MRLFVLTTDYEWLEIDIADNDNVVKGVKQLPVPSDLERAYKTKLLHPDTMITLQNLLDRNILGVYLIKDNIRTVHDIYDRTPEPSSKRRSVTSYDGKKGKKKVGRSSRKKSKNKDGRSRKGSKNKDGRSRKGSIKR